MKNKIEKKLSPPFVNLIDTRSLLTSAKLLVGYLVVGITRELDKKPSLYYPLYIYMAPSLCYNNIYLALKFMLLPHVLLLIHMCFS